MTNRGVSYGSAAFFQVKQETGSLGLRNEKTEVLAPLRLASTQTIRGPPQRVPKPVRSSVDFSMDQDDEPDINYGGAPLNPASSPSFNDATSRFMNADAKKLYEENNKVNSSAKPKYNNLTFDNNSFGQVSEAGKSSLGSFGKIKSFVNGITTYLGGCKPIELDGDDMPSGPEDELDVEKDGVNVNRTFSIEHLLHPLDEPSSKPITTRFKVCGIEIADSRYYDSMEDPASPFQSFDVFIWFQYGGYSFDFHAIGKGTKEGGSAEDVENFTIPFDAALLRQIVFGPCKNDPTQCYLDVYFVQTPHGFCNIGIPVATLSSDRITNFRLIIDVLKEKGDFAMCCKRMKCTLYDRDNNPDDGYQSRRPSDHYEKQQQRNDVPFSAATRKSSRLVGSSPAENFRHSPLPPRHRYNVRKKYEDSDDCSIITPHVPSTGQLLFIYPEDSPDGIHMTTIEKARLQSGVYLNDNLIDFELRRMYNELLSPEQQSRILVFNCFFYKKFSGPKGKDGLSPYERVKSWTKDVNIFEKDLVVLPINEALHWYLAVIVNPGNLIKQAQKAAKEAAELKDAESQRDLFMPDTLEIDSPSPTANAITFDDEENGTDEDDLTSTYIIIIDSLFNNRLSTMKNLKKYLVSEAQAKLGIEAQVSWLKGAMTKDAPRQDNLSDCGCFLLQYAEEVFRNPSTIGQELIGQSHQWFSVEHAKGRRRRMEETLDELGKAYLLSHPDMHAAVEIGNSSDIEEITIDLS